MSAIKGPSKSRMVLAYLATSVIAVPVLVMAGGVPYVDQLTGLLGQKSRASVVG